MAAAPAVVDEDRQAAVEWVIHNKLQAPVDFRFAFCSVEEAAAAGGEGVARLWAELRSVPAPPSSWSLFWAVRRGTQRRPREPVRERTPAPTQPAQQWLRAPRRGQEWSDAPDQDLRRRREAAEQIFAMCLQWGDRCELRQGLASAGADAILEWKELQLQRLGKFEALTLRSALRGWQCWARWCQSASVDPLRAKPADITLYLHSPVPRKRKGAVPPGPTVPLSRWNQLAWLALHAGAPVKPQLRDKPKRQTGKPGSVKDQRVAVEPELCWQLEAVAAAMGPADHLRPIAAAALMLWMSVLRFKHAQRSALVELTDVLLVGVCYRGKKRPAFRWAAPRHGPGGWDAGRRLWDAWYRQTERCALLQFGIVRDSEGSQSSTARRSSTSCPTGSKCLSASGAEGPKPNL